MKLGPPLLSNNRALDWYKSSMATQTHIERSSHGFQDWLDTLRSGVTPHGNPCTFREAEADALIPAQVKFFSGSEPTKGVEGFRIQPRSVVLYPKNKEGVYHAVVCHGTAQTLRCCTILF